MPEDTQQPPEKRTRKKNNKPYVRKANSQRGKYPHVPPSITEHATPFTRFILDEMHRQGGSIETIAKAARFNATTFRRILRGERSTFSYQDLLRIARVLHLPASQLFLLWFDPSLEDAANALFLIQAYMALPDAAQVEVMHFIEHMMEQYVPLFSGIAQQEEQAQMRQLVLQYSHEGDATGTGRKGDTPPLKSQNNDEHGMVYRSPIDFRLYGNGWQEIAGLVELMHDSQYEASDREDVLDMMFYGETTEQGEWLSPENPYVVDVARAYLERMKQERG